MPITSSTVHPSPYLETQSEKLGNRASRYLALSATEYLMSRPEDSLSREKKQELLTSESFYRDLEALFKKHSPPCLERAAFHLLVVPFCQKLASPLFRTATDKITTTALSICKPHASFPNQLMSQKIHHLSSYFSILRSALRRVANEKVVAGDLEKQIAEELEKAQSMHYSSPQLYATSIERGVHFATSSLEEALLAELQERHAFIRYPGQLVIRSTFFSLNLGLAPWVLLGKLWLTQKLKNVATRNVSSLPPTPSELTSPFISFADRLLLSLFKNIQRYKDHSTIPPIDIDTEALKSCIKQQIVLLGLCSSVSDTDLRCAMEDSRLKQLQEQILDNYVLDEIIQSIALQLSIAWQTMTEEGLIEEEIVQLLLALNEGLIYGESNKADLDQLKNTVNKISVYLTKESVHTALSGIEKTLDKRLDPFRWEEMKPFVIKSLSSWAGIEGPIKMTLAGHLIPLVDDISNRAFEKFVKFWKIPYNLRYGLLHYQLLLPHLDT